MSRAGNTPEARAAHRAGAKRGGQTTKARAQARALVKREQQIEEGWDPEIEPLSNKYDLFASGELKVEDMTLEELERGQLMDVDGSFRGAPPKNVPIKYYIAMRDEYQRRLELEHRPLMRVAYEALYAVATGPGQAGVARVSAAKELLDRLGKPITAKTEIEFGPNAEAAYKSLLGGVAVDLGPVELVIENDDTKEIKS